MRTVRIGDKVVSLERARSLIEKIFHLRSKGSTQQEVAAMLGVERSFISHLEGLGEIRRHKEIAFIGSVKEGRDELKRMAEELGIDFIYLLNTGKVSLPETLKAISQAKNADFIVFLGSREEISLFEKVIDRKIIGIPLEKRADTQRVLTGLAQKRTRKIFRTLSRSLKRGGRHERNRKRKSWLLSSGSRSKS